LVILILALVGGMIYYLTPKQASNENNPATSNINSNGKGRVFVADLHERVDIQTKESIERMLYGTLREEHPDLYTGTIRDGSFSETTLPSTQVQTMFLVDIQPAEVTYKVTLFSSPLGRPSVNVACASKQQQLVSSSECKDAYHYE